MKHRRRPFLAFLPVAVFLTAGVFAQIAGTNLEGTIKGKQNLPVDSAVIELTGAAAANRVINSDASGHFKLSDLAPGVYSISISAHGYHTLVRQNVKLRAGESKTLNVKLRAYASPCRASHSVLVWEKNCKLNPGAMTAHGNCTLCHAPHTGGQAPDEGFAPVPKPPEAPKP